MLLLDIGNSRLKWASASPGAPPDAAEHDGRPAPLIESLDLPEAETIWVAHVLDPKHEAAIAAAVEKKCGTAPQFARVKQGLLGLHLAYDEPERLGVDRWLTMLGLWAEFQAAFCVAGAGTALTFDAVNEAGEHQGGLIAPGLSAAQKAVDASTSFNFSKRFDGFTAALGRDTEACVRQGALFACAGMLERASRLAAGSKFITGGDAAVLLKQLGGSWQWKPDAVLQGLRVMSENMWG